MLLKVEEAAVPKDQIKQCRKNFIMSFNSSRSWILEYSQEMFYYLQIPQL